MTAQHLIEIYENLGWLDDGFRTGWSVTSGGGTFANAGTLAGDYAVMTPTSGSPPQVGFSKTVGGGLTVADYPMVRIRVRGTTGAAQCAIIVWYTDSSYTNSGYFTPGTSWMTKNVELTAGKTIGTVQLWAKTAAIEWDYVAFCRNPPLVPEEVEELDVDLQTTVGVSGFRLRLLNDLALESCVLRLPFDENFGSKAYDLSRYRNNGSLLNGPTWVDGRHGKALSFDGSNDYVKVSDSTSLDTTTSEVTVEAWVKPGRTYQSEPEVWYYIVFRAGIQFELGYQGWSDGVSFKPTNSGGTSFEVVKAMTLKSGQWYHLAGVVGPNGFVGLYINGVLEASRNDFTGTLRSGGDLGIGANSSGSNNFNGVIDEVQVYNRALIAEEIYRHHVESPLSGSARAGVGDVAMIYLAGDGETLAEKLIKGRIIERECKGEPDNPVVELVGEAMEELLLERTYTDEFASATQISDVAADIISDQFSEFTRTSIDATSLTIKNRFDEEPAYELLKKLAETAQYADGTKGANFWVDLGDDFHFEKVGKWSGPDLTDGSDGGAKNILDLTVKRTMKGSPKLANDLKLIIFETEHVPKDQDSWTESTNNWTEAGGLGTISLETGDVKSGSASINIHFDENPGTEVTLRLQLPVAVDIAGMTKVKFWLKRTNGIVIDYFDVYLDTQNSWLGVYYKKEGLSPPAVGTWQEYDLNLVDFTEVGSFPSNIITRISLRFRSFGFIGVNDIRVDKLRLERAEIARTASDSESQAKYGRRRAVFVDKTITDQDYAQSVVNGMLERRKRSTVQLRATARGKAQIGFRPPQKIKVTALKDGLNGAYFQIVSVQHRYTPHEPYICVFDLVAAVKPDDTYEPKVMPQLSAQTVGGLLAGLGEEIVIAELGHRRREWQ